MKRAGIFIVIFGSIFLIVASCSSNPLGFLAKRSPWEEYRQKLKKSGLMDNRAGRSWAEAGSDALISSTALEVPFSVSGTFFEKDIRALAWNFEAGKGGSIQISLQTQIADSALIFLDLFAAEDTEKSLASMTSADSLLNYEFRESGLFIIRLQPELFLQGTFTLSVNKEPTYAVFPVLGKDYRAIHSFWGVARDGGSRSHEGVDIFAKRGTPVLAPTKGMVSSVRNAGLGGKQVWLRDSERGYNLYFAHLDSQAVKFGNIVNPGDTLGFVGNTGNAKFTPPHLHFGIYSGEAFDPLPMINDRVEEAQKSDLETGIYFKVVNSSQANFRKGPSIENMIINTFYRNTILYTLAVVEDWYEVQTPVGSRGFIHASLLADIDPQATPAGESWVYMDPFQFPEDSVQIGLQHFNIIGEYENYQVLTDSARNILYTRK